ncbi:uncharacterized protein LOC118793521 [Megalops cyprinoides]|uniref:uncharacterized protein LOC118793521 n=1 Tax=Megalops cyprinoides TaxID=118141 RepID=UPI001864887B|nr:uncharacterized protein LOC118793521 [Megalops cyprinoides]
MERGTGEREKPSPLFLAWGDVGVRAGQGLPRLGLFPQHRSSATLYTYQTGDVFVSLTLPFSLALLSLLGAFNLSVLWLLRRGGTGHISAVTTRVLLSMGLADVAVCVSGVPALLLSDFQVPLPFYPCLLLSCAVLGSALVSSLHHVLMAYYRWILLTQPHRNRYKLTRTSTLLHLFLCWMVGVAISCLPYLGFNNYTNLQGPVGQLQSNSSTVQGDVHPTRSDYINHSRSPDPPLAAASDSSTSAYTLAFRDTKPGRRDEAKPTELYPSSGLTFNPHKPVPTYNHPVPPHANPSSLGSSASAGYLSHRKQRTPDGPVLDAPFHFKAVNDPYHRMRMQRNSEDHFHKQDSNSESPPTLFRFPPLPHPPRMCSGPPSQCLVPCVYQNVLSLGYLTYVIFLGSVGLPLLAVSLLYFLTFRSIRQHCLSHHQAGPAPLPPLAPSPASSLFYRRQRRVACFTILLFTLYFLSRLPFNVLNAVMYACPSCRVPEWAPPIALLSAVLSAGSNPLLYLLRGRAGLADLTRRR